MNRLKALLSYSSQYKPEHVWTPEAIELEKKTYQLFHWELTMDRLLSHDQPFQDSIHDRLSVFRSEMEDLGFSFNIDHVQILTDTYWNNLSELSQVLIFYKFDKEYDQEFQNYLLVGGGGNWRMKKLNKLFYTLAPISRLLGRVCTYFSFWVLYLFYKYSHNAVKVDDFNLIRNLFWVQLIPLAFVAEYTRFLINLIRRATKHILDPEKKNLNY